MQNVKRLPASTLRWRKMRAGIVAVVFLVTTWTAMKQTRKTEKIVRRRMIRHEFQAWVVPPHCSARSREMMEGRKKRVPIGSSCRICFRHGK